jgi:hypothetical protein
MLKVAAYILKGNGLAERVVPLLAAGAKLFEQVDTYTDKRFVPEHVAQYDVAILWGYVETCQEIMRAYKAAGKVAVYLDLAYWERDSYYKVSINARHPTEYFQKRNHDDARRRKFIKSVAPFKTGSWILVAGMGAKAAWAEKCEPVNSWERTAIEGIKYHTDRPIVFRPKTGVVGPIDGTIFGADQLLSVQLDKAHAVVTHHSNVAVEGLVAGVPAFAWYGVSSVMGLQDLSKIEAPYYPENREQWLNDVAYTQWSVDELRDGICWRHLKDEGLV